MTRLQQKPLIGFLGDNTGVGKGRTCAATLMDGWLAGHQRSIWLSRSQTLIEDAIRDWTDIGGAPTDIVPLSRFKADQPIPVTKGILFATYATLRAQAKGGETRLEQLIAWAGEDFEGHIAFDEAHAMQNAAGSSEGRGTKPSQQGIAGLRLQFALPRARITYISATGATTVQNLACASRLGIWGPGQDYPSPSRDAFVSAMDAGGVAAMDIVARDLKALGLYISSGLSLEGVEYDALEHALTPAQIETYNTYARAFKVTRPKPVTSSHPLWAPVPKYWRSRNAARCVRARAECQLEDLVFRRGCSKLKNACRVANRYDTRPSKALSPS